MWPAAVVKGSGQIVTRVLLAACVATVLAGCGAGEQQPGSVRTPAPTSASCPAQTFDPVDGASVLVPGPTNGRQPPEAKTEKLIVAAVVLDTACAPLSGAKLTIWHTDPYGNYGPSGPGSCCYYKGTVQSDGNGRFRLETVRPGQYTQPNAPPAHIHVQIEHQSGRMETEIVFVSMEGARSSSDKVVPVALRQISEPDEQYWYGEATFVLRRRR